MNASASTLTTDVVKIPFPANIYSGHGTTALKMRRFASVAEDLAATEATIAIVCWADCDEDDGEAPGECQVFAMIKTPATTFSLPCSTKAVGIVQAGDAFGISCLAADAGRLTEEMAQIGKMGEMATTLIPFDFGSGFHVEHAAAWPLGSHRQARLSARARAATRQAGERATVIVTGPEADGRHAIRFVTSAGAQLVPWKAESVDADARNRLWMIETEARSLHALIESVVQGHLADIAPANVMPMPTSTRH